MEKLLDIARKERINLEYSKLPDNLLGLYVAKGSALPLIILDKTLKSDYRLHRCILAEEIGHHFTSVGQTICPAANFPFWQTGQSKAELKALRWSAMHLIPYKNLMQAVHKESLHLIWQLAEKFDVTEELMLFRLQFLHKNDFLCDEDISNI